MNHVTLPPHLESEREPLLLALDASTTALKCQLFTCDTLELVYSKSVDYGSASPARLPSQHEAGRALFPSGLFFRALDEALLALGLAWLNRVVAITGCAQQHTCVLFTSPLGAPLDARLRWQVPVFDWSPTWQDSSTQRECAIMAAHLGSTAERDVALEISGSTLCQRFTGPQLAKLDKDVDLGAFTRVALLSQALTSVLANTLVPADLGDAAGMNLVDLHTLEWSPQLVEAVCQAASARLSPPALLRLLGSPPVPSATWYPLSPFFAQRYGLPASARVLSFTGDNLASFVACECALVLSFGTSDTVCGSVDANAPSRPGSHTLVDPLDPSRRVRMLCWANGSASREAVMKRTAKSWDEFDALLVRGLNDADARRCLSLEFPDVELIPATRRPGLKAYARIGDANVSTQGEPHASAHVDAFAVVWTRVLAMKSHAASTGMRAHDRVVVTGGAASNRGLVQIVSDVFGVPVDVADQGACLGGALRLQRALGGEPLAARKRAKPASVQPRSDVGLEAELFALLGRMEAALASVSP